MQQPPSEQNQDPGIMKHKPFKPEEAEAGEEDKVPPSGQDWQPIDLSKGTIKKGIFGSRRSFKTHVRQDLRKDLSTLLSAKQREEVSEEITKLRSHGLGRGEVQKKLNEMVKQGKLTKFEAKRLRREFGATKSSLF